ncbi:unnamed protein product [Parnassius mnemosyne]|uniref:HAT C-terminal dimerisation domain-containing protein n=1 Tax=Parnassius mnemosyne TaxID=213953 RepID=A0AAV1M5N6_9NEOP
MSNSNPFTISVENAPESMQLEIIDIQNDQDLRNKFNEGDLLNFYRCIDKNTYKELRINALKCASLFGSNYICEQTFSILNNNKTKNRNRLENESLEAVLRVATSKFEPNIKKGCKHYAVPRFKLINSFSILIHYYQFFIVFNYLYFWRPAISS